MVSVDLCAIRFHLCHSESLVQLEVAVIVVVMMRKASGEDHLIRTKNINSSVRV